jgi:F420-non-reducing hydrogenase small subunit
LTKKADITEKSKPAEKPKVALYWCASCGGCEEAILDMAEDLLSILNLVDVVFWPVAMDFKRHDVEKMPDGSITVSLINGAVRTSEQEEMVKLLRRKSQLIVGFGACAHMGGVPALANLYEKRDLLRTVYLESPSTPNTEGTLPDPEGRKHPPVPHLHEVVRALDQTIDVDYYIPGCPPTPDITKQALLTILKSPPEKGTVLAPDTALCEECPRKDTKPDELVLEKFERVHLKKVDPEKCFLAQGIPCMGIGTRRGCEALCIKGNMPCTGCFGPTNKVLDHGAKLLSAFASMLIQQDEASIDRAISTIPDPAGSFYRYGLAKSLLLKRVRGEEK